MANLNYPKVAEFILSMVAQTTVRADDDTIAAVQASRAMLKAIVAGQLIISEPPQEPTP